MKHRSDPIKKALQQFKKRFFQEQKRKPSDEECGQFKAELRKLMAASAP